MACAFRTNGLAHLLPPHPRLHHLFSHSLSVFLRIFRLGVFLSVKLVKQSEQQVMRRAEVTRQGSSVGVACGVGVLNSRGLPLGVQREAIGSCCERRGEREVDVNDVGEFRS